MRPILLIFLFVMTGAQAATLQICPASGAGQSATSTAVTLPGGESRRIIVSDTPISGCKGTLLPVPINAIVAVRSIPSALFTQPGNTLLLQGLQSDGQFHITSVVAGSDVAGTTARPRPMPLHENLLQHVRLRTFGVETRAQARFAAGRLKLHCTGGSHPAGVILSAPWYMSRAELSLRLTASGSGRFEVQALDSEAAKREAPVALGYLNAPLAETETAFGIPHSGFDRSAWRAFAIACPQQDAVLDLSALRVVPRTGVVPMRSTWVWQSRAWRDRAEDVFLQARQHGIDTLFISVPTSGGKVSEPDHLAGFIRDATRQGIAVWSVDGDPGMVIPREHNSTIERAHAYAAYNRSVEPEARLRGMQFDIEPYLLPEYESASREWDRHYLDLARALHRAAQGMPLEFVVPFWWSDKPDLLHRLASHASSLTVMDYRTDPEEIMRFAVPFLDWGTLHGRRVRIALEAGPIAPELQHRYVKAASGQVWILPVQDIPVMLLLKGAYPNPAGPSYRLISSRTIDGSATTFHRHPEKLLSLLPALEKDFSAWTVFGGIALHEIR